MHDTGEEGESITRVPREGLNYVACGVYHLFLSVKITRPFFVLPSRTNHEQKTIMRKSEKNGVVYKFYNTDQANSCPNVNMVQRF